VFVQLAISDRDESYQQVVSSNMAKKWMFVQDGLIGPIPGMYSPLRARILALSLSATDDVVVQFLDFGHLFPDEL